MNVQFETRYFVLIHFLDIIISNGMAAFADAKLLGSIHFEH